MTQSEIDSANEAVLYWVSLAGASIPPTQSGMDEAEEAGREALERLCEAAKPAEDLVGRIGRWENGDRSKFEIIAGDGTWFVVRPFGTDMREVASRGDFDLLPDAPEDERREPCGP